MIGGTRVAHMPRRKSRAALRLRETPRGGERHAPPPGGFHSLPFPKSEPGLPRLLVPELSLLSVSSDGTPVFSGVLEANQTKTIEGKEFAKLRIGNAAGLEVRLNGKPLGPLGAHGQVRDLVFTPDKFQFVSSPKEGE
jgi:hypothetical protein